MAPESAQILCANDPADAGPGRFICQCAALVNPFLSILTVFSATGSLSGKNHAESDQLRRNYRC
jgi:hypothetical protein